MSTRLYEGTAHAQIYAQFRPSYPDKLFDEIIKYLGERIPVTEWKLAVDVGCGSGQGTNQLSKYFQKCYGFDVSPAQISEAKESNHSDNVFYAVSPAESLPSIETNSVQLLTSFAAAHWFDWPKFIEEANRVVVKDGVVAMICYHMPGPDIIDPTTPEDIRLSDLMADIWFDKRLAQYKNKKIELAEDHFKDLHFPSNYECVRKEGISDSKRVNAHDLIGFCQSWSAFQTLQTKDRQSAEQCLNEFADKLKNILGVEDLKSKELIITYHFFIFMARKRAEHLHL